MGLDNPLHIAFIVVILLLLFGAKRLPEIGRQLGTGMREFKQSVMGQGEHEQPALTQAQQIQAPAPQAPAAAPAATAAPAPAQAPAPEPTQQA
jgi:sec-independent protein translocase protein TatA